MQAITMGMMVSLSSFALLSFFIKEVHHASHPLMCPHRIEKLANFFLKEDDEGDDTHANQLVEDASKESHFEHLAHQQPHQHKEHDADEDVK